MSDKYAAMRAAGMTVIDGNRQTGRTHRMLQEVIAAVTAGEHPYVLSANHQQAKHMERRYLLMGGVKGAATFTAGNDDALRGASVTFRDHYAVESQLARTRADLDAANARADEAEACIKSLMLSMRLWGAEEDGIPDDPTTGAWAAYSRAKCLLCPEREAYRCTEYDLKSCAICEPCAACGKIRKHSFASFFVEDADGHFTVTCNDTCARNAASAREAVRHERPL